MKPEKKIYEILLKRYNLNPEECVFIDDQPTFLPPANDLGIITILYNENTNLRKELNKFDINI